MNARALHHQKLLSLARPIRKAQPPTTNSGHANFENSTWVKEINHNILTREAEEALFMEYEAIFEGEMNKEATHYCGSLMMTFPLNKWIENSHASFQGKEKIEISESLRQAILGSTRIRIRANRLALDELKTKLVGFTLGTAELFSKVYLKSTNLLIDVDFKVPLEDTTSAA